MTIPPGARPDGAGYIRGGGGIVIGGRRLLGILAVLCALGLLAAGALLLAGAVRHHSQLAALHERGVPVEATVSRCLAISSGIGMGVEYWQCQGRYSLAGKSYEEVIAGSRSLLAEGETIPAVAVPGHPSLLSTAARAERPDTPDWPTLFGGASVSLVALGLIAAVVLARSNRAANGISPSRRPHAAGPPC